MAGPSTAGCLTYSGTMRTQNSSRRTAALALTAVALLGVTGCSAFPSGANPSSSSSSAPGDEGDGTQTTAEACQLILDTITDATEEFQNVDPDNPGALVDGMKQAAQTLGDASSQITNEEVAAMVPELQATFEQVAVVMEAIIGGDTPEPAEVEEMGAAFAETTQEVQDLCAPTG